jgi:hypothetical protein
LYLDPHSASYEHPMLYADCEGLDGSEREPLGVRFKKRRINRSTTPGREDQLTPVAQLDSEREVIWANSSEKRSRQFTVASLYPRLLYTFSDVILFVLRKPR